ncbi:glycosyltransferase [Patescibacteria group bacterium]|nr:glycosyltransferase [Patescibacteria group bacterium]MBU1066212.1 glycosyltransferase [Patescibacteria group bacterium]
MLYLLETLKKIPKMRLCVVLPSDGALGVKLTRARINWIIHPYKWWTVRRGESRRPVNTFFYTHLDSAKRLKNKIEKFHPDLVVTNTSTICIGALVANMLRVPHIWYVRELGEKDHGFIFEFGFAFTAKFINDFSSRVIFNSKAVMKEFGKYILRSKSTVVYNSIRINRKLFIKKLPVTFNYPNAFKLLIAGTISKKKGQLDIIRATSLLLVRKLDVELLILGRCTDDVFMKKIHNLIDQSGKKWRFQVRDFIENPYPLFQQCDAVLVCSKNEAFGRTILEGMLFKKPVIAADGGGVSEIIKHEKNGFLYTHGNYEDLASKIELVMTNSKLRENIAICGFDTAKGKFLNKNYSYKLANIFKSTRVFSSPSKRWVKRLNFNLKQARELGLEFN